LLALNVAARNPSRLLCKNIILVPPLVTKTILEIGSLDPATLIPILVQVFKDFDTTSENVKACTALLPIIEFLWTVLKNSNTPVTFTPELSPEGKNWTSSIHLSHIAKTEENPQSNKDQTNALDTIADSLWLLSKSSTRSLLNNPQGDTNKRDNQSSNWDKIPEVIQKMIIKISSTNDQSFVPSPCKTYLQIFSMSLTLMHPTFPALTKQN